MWEWVYLTTEGRVSCDEHSPFRRRLHHGPVGQRLEGYHLAEAVSPPEEDLPGVCVMAGKKDLGKLFCDIARFTDMVNRLALLAGNNMTDRLSNSASKELPLEERLCLNSHRYKGGCEDADLLFSVITDYAERIVEMAQEGEEAVLRG